MSADGLCLAAILLLALMVMALFFLRGRRGARASHFSVVTPSPPAAVDAAAQLAASLDGLVGAGRRFLAEAPAANPTPSAGVLTSVTLLVRQLARATDSLQSTPPTIVNHMAVYRGLVTTDESLRDAADAFARAGRSLQGAADNGRAACPPGLAAASRAGGELVALAAHLRRTVAATHRLGAALGLE